VARDATARLYDVDEDLVEYNHPKKVGKYDEGTITFFAKKGRLVDLDKLHESIWATRLSGGTNSGVVSLEVTAVGEVIVTENETRLLPKGAGKHFVLINDPDAKADEAPKDVLAQLEGAIAAGKKVVRVTGHVQGWHGKWPVVLRQPPEGPWRLVVSSFETGN
jgi:hypothetical protein